MEGCAAGHGRGRLGNARRHIRFAHSRPWCAVMMERQMDRPKTQAVFLGGVEWLENAFRVRRQTAAGVRNRNPHRAITVRRRQGQVPARRRIGGHRVAGIEDQIEQHLLELDAVAQNLRQVLGQRARGP